MRSELKKILAWGAHLLTISGVAWGFLALLAVERLDHRAVMLWMALAILIDSVDGTLSRLARVDRYAPGLDGALLDNIIDYFTYVIVPAYWLYRGGLLPSGWELPAALTMLAVSAYQFSQADAKTADHYFKGFPSYWNVVVAYLLLLRTPAWVNLGLVALCAALVFVPVKYVYPSRTRFHRTLTLSLTTLYGALITWLAWQYPGGPVWAAWASLAYVAYYVILSLIRKPTVEVSDEPVALSS